MEGNRCLEGTSVGRVEAWSYLLVLLIVLIFAGAGFALHVLWIAAVIFGSVLANRRCAGTRRIFRTAQVLPLVDEGKRACRCQLQVSSVSAVREVIGG
jgi:hypothetical protein